MSDEPKRITEEELRIVESLEEGNRSALLFARRLVAEVRRLRGLIVAAHPDFPPSMDEAVRRPAAADAIEAEALAIREEQGR